MSKTYLFGRGIHQMKRLVKQDFQLYEDFPLDSILFNFINEYKNLRKEKLLEESEDGFNGTFSNKTVKADADFDTSFKSFVNFLLHNAIEFDNVILLLLLPSYNSFENFQTFLNRNDVTTKYDLDDYFAFGYIYSELHSYL